MFCFFRLCPGYDDVNMRGGGGVWGLMADADKGLGGGGGVKKLAKF